MMLLISAFIVLVSSAFFLMGTGFVSREYAVRAPHELVNIANTWLTLADVALTYKPRFYMQDEPRSPKARILWWDAVDDRTSNTLVVIYHVVWDDVLLPISFLHHVYRMYRALYYGIPALDIQYIQVHISYADGTVQRVRYEGTFATTYNTVMCGHKIVNIIATGDTVVEYACRPNGSLFSVRPIAPLNVPLRFGVASWDHRFVLLDPHDTSRKEIELPLMYLDDETYRRHKFARQSQGDYETKEPYGFRLAAIVFLLCFLGDPSLFEIFSSLWGGSMILLMLLGFFFLQEY